MQNSLCLGKGKGGKRGKKQIWFSFKTNLCQPEFDNICYSFLLEKQQQ